MNAYFFSLLLLMCVTVQKTFSQAEMNILPVNTKRQLIKELAHIHAINLSGIPHHDGTILPIYFDLRLLISYPDLLLTFAQELNTLIARSPFNVLCGVPQAAIPLTTAVSMVGNYPMILQRKEAKGYGTKKFIEGKYVHGNTCALIEDVIVSGFSILESIKILENQGLVVKDVYVLIDREQGGMENIRKHGYTIHALFTMSEILDILREEGVITAEQFAHITRFCEQSRSAL